MLELFQKRLQRAEQVFWDEESGAVKAKRLVRLEALILEEAPLAKPDPEAVLAAMLVGLRSLGLAALPWSEAARQLQARVESMRRWQPATAWPDVSDETCWPASKNGWPPGLPACGARNSSKS